MIHPFFMSSTFMLLQIVICYKKGTRFSQFPSTVSPVGLSSIYYPAFPNTFLHVHIIVSFQFPPNHGLSNKHL